MLQPTMAAAEQTSIVRNNAGGLGLWVDYPAANRAATKNRNPLQQI